MNDQRRRNLRLALAGSLLAVAASSSVVAQDPTLNTDEDVSVTSDPATWVRPATGDGIAINAGISGVTINNDVDGQIQSSDAAGIRNSGDINVDNSGNISGAVEGINFLNALGTGSITNRRTGVISSASRAINVGDARSISNEGRIVGTGDQRNGTVYSDESSNGFTIDNQTAGIIDAGAGNAGAGFSAELSAAGNDFKIENAGQIAGRGNAGAGGATAGDGIRLERVRVGGALDGTTTGRFTGEINNSGSITSEGANGTVGAFRAVNGVDFQGKLNNSGTISGTQNGVYFGNAVGAGGADHTGGVVNNSGKISSGSRALNIDGRGLTVNNSGSILGTGDQRNGTVYSDGTAQDFSLNNSGTIDAGAGNKGAGFSAELTAEGNRFSIDNQRGGSITGRGQAAPTEATAGDGVRLGAGTFTGDIRNAGTIASKSTQGPVGGFRAVNGSNFQGQLSNTGTISGANNGVYFGEGDHTDGVVNNRGTIRSDSRALNIDGSNLRVNNDGLIQGTGDQRNGTIYADSTAEGFTLNNRGTVDAGEHNQGAAFSVELAETGNDFTINNSGTLRGRGSASAGAGVAGDGIRLERARNAGALDGTSTGLFTGTINNSGEITSESNNGTTGGFRAVNGTSFQGTLNNTGTISGTQNGVYFGNATPAGGADHTGGVVNNSGTISSDSRAFNLDGSGLTVNNSGDIAATGAQRNGTFYIDGTASDFSVTNLSGGSIDARGGSGSGLSFQVGVAPDSIQTGTITNAGLIAGSGNDPLNAGVRLFAGADGATFQGDIVNEFGGVITADIADAVLVQDGVNFDGSLINNGVIDGSISLASGDLFLGDTSTLALSIDGLAAGQFDTVSVADDLTLGGTLALSFGAGFDPIVGQQFDLFDAGSFAGNFASIVADGFVLDTTQLSAGGTGSISIAAVATAVPEPGTATLLLVGGVVFAGRRRRRQDIA